MKTIKFNIVEFKPVASLNETEYKLKATVVTATKERCVEVPLDTVMDFNKMIGYLKGGEIPK